VERGFSSTGRELSPSWAFDFSVTNKIHVSNISLGAPRFIGRLSPSLLFHDAAADIMGEILLEL